MFHVDNNTGVPVMPPVAAELSKTTLYFTEGGNGIPPTYPGPDWFNIIQSELLKILEEAGITPDKADTGQIMAALKKLFITNSGSAGAIAGLTGQENTFPYFTGEDTMALTPLSAFVRGILGKTSASEFVKSISAGCAFSGSVAVGGDNGNWTTAQFIEWLESQGAFNHPYWMCKGSWYYAGNKIITDTGCGNIQLAGAVVEVMGTKSAMTIRVTTPTTAPNGTPGAQFTYINHGDGYSPGWRRTGDAVTSVGRITAMSGTDRGATTGLQMYEAYNNGYPATYGNVLHLKGRTAAGEGELFIGWSGTSGAHAPVYIRSRRDTDSATWSDWAQVYTSKDSFNAATATKLQTARKINGVAFDGTSDITITATDTTSATAVRLGSVSSYTPSGNEVSWTQNLGDGNVLTGMIIQDTGKNSADNIGGIYYRRLQYCVNGTWLNASSV